MGELNKKVNLLKAFDQLSFSNAPTPSADGFSQNQRIQQESAHNPTFRQIPEAASLKLAEIEQVLKPHCPPTFVQNVITGLIKNCKETGDYSNFDRALENHKRNVERYRSRN